MLEKDNRKSHLVPQASPANSQELLRNKDSPDSLPIEDLSINTPTSGDIPIANNFIPPREQYNNRSPVRNGSAAINAAYGRAPTSSSSSYGRQPAPPISRNHTPDSRRQAYGAPPPHGNGYGYSN